MNSFSFNNIVNTSTVDALTDHWNSLSSFVVDLVAICVDKQSKSLTIALENLPYTIHFSHFQWKLLKSFSLILIINLILICVAWRIFGKNICERFMKPATSKAVEELKASVSKLKLPKEHTPRI